MKQYSEILNKIINEGEWIYNERTGKRCKTIINVDLEYDFCPLVTTRKSYWKSAVAEFVGYLRGYSSAADFRALGTTTWNANANENKAWLDNPYRKGLDDMGRVYGCFARDLKTPEFYDAVGSGYITGDETDAKLIEKHLEGCGYNKNPWVIDQLKNVYENLKQGIDNRGEIITFYIPAEFHMGCLRPCMHTHTFSLVNGTLHLTSYQRSADWCLGMNFNMVQCYFFLHLMSQITGHKPGKVYHKIVNAHIYEDQYDTALIEASREPLQSPIMKINERIKTLEDVETIFTLDDVDVLEYNYHPALKYPFSV